MKETEMEENPVYPPYVCSFVAPTTDHSREVIDTFVEH